MWKWIIGAVLLLLIMLIGLSVWGYRRLTAGGSETSVTIGAPAETVWASLANPDSMAAWMGEVATITTEHRGVLGVGDTVHVRASSPGSKRNQRFAWVVSELAPPRLLVLQMRNDTSGLVAVMRDSLVTVGDSTRVVSTTSSPLIDSIRTIRGDTGSRKGN